MLNEIMLDAGLTALSEDLREVDLAAADVDHAVLGWARRVLDVNHGKAAGISVEELQRVTAAELHPIKIHLEVDEVGIGVHQQQVEWSHSLDRPYFEIVIVVGESQALRHRRCAKGVELTRELLPVIYGLPSLF